MLHDILSSYSTIQRMGTPNWIVSFLLSALTSINIWNKINSGTTCWGFVLWRKKNYKKSWFVGSGWTVSSVSTGHRWLRHQSLGIYPVNKLASLGYASPKLRLTYRLTYLLTGVKCRATSVAKNYWYTFKGSIQKKFWSPVQHPCFCPIEQFLATPVSK